MSTLESRVLLTGCTGFVGTHLKQRLLSTAEVQLVTVARTEQPSSHPGHVHYQLPDFNASSDWSDPLKDVNTVIHCAGRAHIMAREDADLAEKMFHQVNTEATINLARQAVKAGVSRFIFISSIKVNGEQSTCFSPDDTPAPVDAYGRSKWQAEQALWALSQETGLEVVIIRPPLVYGPGVKANFRTLIRWTERGIPLPLASITAKRSLVFVSNLTDFIMFCLQHPEAANQTFMISDGDDQSIAELLKKTAQAMNKTARLFPVPVWILKAGARLTGKMAIYQRLCQPLCVSIESNRRLGWTPPYSVEDALKATCQFKEMSYQATSSDNGQNS